MRVAVAATLIATFGLSSVHAFADKLTEIPEVVPKLQLSIVVQENVSDYSNMAAIQVSDLTLGLVDMRFDVEKKWARFRLGGGQSEYFRLKLNSDIQFQKGKARLATRVELGMAGHQWQIEVPELDLDTESVSGERAVTLSLPLLEGQF